MGRGASYPAPIAFTLAHEVGHTILGHLDGAPALIDLEDPVLARHGDSQEQEADRFALELFTGDPDPDIQPELDCFNAPTLANAVLAAADRYRVESGTLALCLAHQRRMWPVAMSALRFIYDRVILAIGAIVEDAADGRIACLEQLMAEIVKRHGAVAARPHVCAEPDADRAIRADSDQSGS